MTRHHFVCCVVFLHFVGAEAEQAWAVNENHQVATQFGDMLLTPAQLARYTSNSQPGSTQSPVRGGAVVVENSYNRWPNNVVHYTLSSHKKIIRDSLIALESLSCFKFVERTTEKDYIFIAPLDGCYSFVGRTGGRQPVSLSLDCLADYIIWHEILHVLGFEHEHQRPDRDSFIRVEYKNVQPGQIVNFEKLLPGSVELNEPYDYQSIMHYEGNAFGRWNGGRRLVTMTPVQRNVQLIDNMAFSHTDLKKLRALGKCEQQAPPKPKCLDLSPICEKAAARGYCNHESYYNILKDDCKKSCKWCRSREEPNHHNAAENTEKAKPCVDELKTCANLAKNGFCTNAFYREFWPKCARSCNLC